MVFNCETCLKSLQSLIRVFISTGISYRFLSEITGNDRDPYLQEVSEKLDELSTALEDCAHSLIQFIEDNDASFSYRDSGVPAWKELPKELKTVLGAHRNTTVLIGRTLQAMATDGHTEEVQFLKEVIRKNRVAKIWRKLQIIINPHSRDSSESSGSEDEKGPKTSVLEKKSGEGVGEVNSSNTAVPQDKKESYEIDSDSDPLLPIENTEYKKNSVEKLVLKKSGYDADSERIQDKTEGIAGKTESSQEEHDETRGFKLSSSSKQSGNHSKEGIMHSTMYYKESVTETSVRISSRTEATLKDADSSADYSEFNTSEIQSPGQLVDEHRLKISGRRVLIITKADDVNTTEAERIVEQYLVESTATLAHHPSDISLIICLGGDGTLLKCSSLFNKKVPPTLTFALGHDNFLYSFKWNEQLAKDTLASLLEGGHYTSISRHRLSILISNSGGPASTLAALNEVSLRREGPRHLAELDVFLDNSLLFTTRGDGLIVSTATGSTAYNLSAGGPRVHPTMNCMVVTPLCNHPHPIQSVVLPPASTLSIRLADTGRTNNVYVAVDSNTEFQLNSGWRLDISMSEYPLEQIVAVDGVPTDPSTFNQSWTTKVRNQLN